MRIVLQRVANASVSVAGVRLGAIEKGLLVLVGFTHADTPQDTIWMAEKVMGLRVFPDDEGKMNRSVMEAGGQILVVSQFTLYGDAVRGRRPSFVDAARPDAAIPLYESFLTALRTGPVRVATGEFGADMQVELTNDGPVTLVIERGPNS